MIQSKIKAESSPPFHLVRSWQRQGLLLALYFMVALAFTFPLVANLGDRVILARGGDVWQHLWNNWWMRFSLLELKTHPFNTPLLFHPVGSNLFYHALDPLDGYISTPLQIWGVVPAFNLIILMQVTLAGYFSYQLANYLTGNGAAALVAGVIYACSPLESLLINLGQLELSSIEWLPAFILCFIRALNRDTPRWLWRSLSVVLLVALSLTTWYYALYAIIFSGLYTLYFLLRQRTEWRTRWLATLAVATGIGAIYAVLILPVLLPTLREAGSGATQQPLYTVIYNSATVKGLFNTGPSLLWGIFGSSDNPEFRGNFLGFFTLLLAVVGLVAYFRRTWFWGFLGAVFLGLAFGPVLHYSFNPEWTPQSAEAGISLPGRLLYNLPLGNIARVPLRYGLVTMLGLAILAAFGLSFIMSHLKMLPGQPGWRTWLLPAIAALLIFAEFMPGARPLADTTIPPFYQQIAKEGKWNDFAILETPDRANATIISKAMYYQTSHAHPIVGGYISRKPAYPFRDYPGINNLLNLDFRGVLSRDIIERANLSNAVLLLRYYNIRYVVLHPELLTDENSRFDANEVLQTVFGKATAPYYQDTFTQVWRVPEVSLAPTPNVSLVLLQLNGGWGQRQDTPRGAERAIKERAQLSLFNPFATPLVVKLQASVQSGSDATNLKFTLNELTQPDVRVSNTAGLELSLALQPGLNSLVITPGESITLGKISLS